MISGLFEYPGSDSGNDCFDSTLHHQKSFLSVFINQHKPYRSMPLNPAIPEKTRHDHFNRRNSKKRQAVSIPLIFELSALKFRLFIDFEMGAGNIRPCFRQPIIGIHRIADDLFYLGFLIRMAGLLGSSFWDWAQFFSPDSRARTKP